MLRHWMAIYTKPRSEKKAAERLERNGIDVYCPLQTTLRQWSDRKKKVKVPVFPSYVFVKVNEKERQIVLQDPSVLNFVYWQGKPAIIKNEEIEVIKECLAGTMNEAEVVGDEITITQGVLSGTKGKIKEIKGNKIILTIESVGITVTISRKEGSKSN